MDNNNQQTNNEQVPTIQPQQTPAIQPATQELPQNDTAPQQSNSNVYKWITLIVVLILIIGLGLFFIKSNLINNNSQQNKERSTKALISPTTFVSAQKNFGFNYLQMLNKLEPNKSIIISPFSIETALAMVYAGSEKETKQEIAKVMGLSNPNSEKLNTEIKEILTSLNKSKGATVEIANSFWGAKRIDFNKAYVDTLVNNYEAKIKSVDFGDPKTKDLINKWVSDKTHQKIPKIIDETKAGQIIALINAVYFNGDWQDPFKPTSTKEKDFTNSAGKVIKTQTMVASRNFDYYENDDLQMLTMPYKNQNIKATILLPKNESATSFLSDLTETNWKKWNDNLANKEGILELPKFELNYSRDMLDDLKMLGMKKSTIDADFNPMFVKPPTLPVAISKAIHKTFMRMDEKGTEAAAVTYIGIDVTSMPGGESEKPFEMIVNKPYIIALTDETTDSMLFLGIIQDPTEK